MGAGGLKWNGKGGGTSSLDISISANWRPCLRPLCPFLLLDLTLEFRLYISMYILRFPSDDGDVQFFFVSTTPGLADVIMSPALRASSKRKSWISWRLGDAMVAEMVYSSMGQYEKKPIDFPR